MTVVEWIVFILAAVGTLFMLVSAIGIVRLPGVHASMHAVGKASTWGSRRFSSPRASSTTVRRSG